MRINRDILLNIARDTVAQRTRQDRNIIAVYLCGALLEEDYLLGGTADIDLVCIHIDDPVSEREIVRLSDEVHLDIAHHRYQDYRQTRNLRVDAWAGPTLNSARVMHDPQHFLDFTQASVRGQFDRPDHILERTRKQAETARRIWLGFHDQPVEPAWQEVTDYLRAVGQAANAIASLSGSPLAERRFLLNFPARAAAVGKPGLQAGLLGLLGASAADVDILTGWLPLWQAAYQAIPPESAPPRLQPPRMHYYRQAFIELLAGSQAQAVLWPLLRTWTLAVHYLPEDSDHFTAWRQAVGYLGLQKNAFRERVAGLDAYLDMVEETIDNWALSVGV